MMNYEKVGKGRATINDKGNALEIIIPAKKNLPITLFMCAWLGGWAFGLVMTITTMLPASTKAGNAGIPAFIVFWLIAWTIGGGVVVSTVIWNLAGKEIIELSSDSLKLQRRALTVSRSKQYSLPEVKNLRLAQIGGSQPMFGWSSGDFGGLNGSLAFDYGMKTIRFARGIDEAEASYILGLMKQRSYR